MVQSVTVDQAPIIGVCPSWVMQSSSWSCQAPRPSSTAKAAGDPSVHCLHRARISGSSVGLNGTTMGSIVRPSIPPADVHVVHVEVDGRHLVPVLLVGRQSLLTGQGGQRHDREHHVDPVAHDPSGGGAGLGDRPKGLAGELDAGRSGRRGAGRRHRGQHEDDGDGGDDGHGDGQRPEFHGRRAPAKAESRPADGSSPGHGGLPIRSRAEPVGSRPSGVAPASCLEAATARVPAAPRRGGSPGMVRPAPPTWASWLTVTQTGSWPSKIAAGDERGGQGDRSSTPVAAGGGE